MKDFSSTVHSTKQPNRAHRVVTFFFRKMPLLWIERNGKFLSIKKANTKGEEKSRIKRTRASHQLYSIPSIKSKLQLLCYSAHGSSDTTLPQQLHAQPEAPSWPATTTTPNRLSLMDVSKQNFFSHTTHTKRYIMRCLFAYPEDDKW